ncbi:hypothetical protein A1Q2_00095 [Trichosporon asahii var. asahii CBS 8904]|uniref:Major facilitator superfamily (MFS) profile domain-containing protein n=1 Tax=Trichosporon asahii var. asahii (strain CBS 8904) TaxID=1220162 RepID=K1VN43_TRIAC|nr:hypothetical protein A1Q2_00095 [Trichosporon asahii var. asahii CBS 8904]
MSGVQADQRVSVESKPYEDRKEMLDDDVDRHYAVEIPQILKDVGPEEQGRIDRRVTRKIDMLLMPPLVILFILNFLDRNNVSTAKVGGMTEDLRMSGQEFSTVVAVLFAGYISLQVPSNMIASRVKWPSFYICCMTAAWGTVSACTGAVNNYHGLLVCRLILGFTEAAFFPGALFLLSLFYTKRQIAFRTAILYSGSQLGNAFGGLFAMACLQLDGTHKLEGWRWLFIIEGAMTVGFSLIFATFIPNRPETCRWFTDAERAQAVYRLQLDRATKDASSEMSIGTATKLVFTDPKVYLIMIALTVNFIASAVTNFFPVVIREMDPDYSKIQSLGMTAPPYVLCVITIWIMGYWSDRIQRRTIFVVISMAFNVLANIIAVATTNVGARYFAMMLMPASFYTSSTIILSWMSSTIVGPDIKKATAFALINAVANTSNIWTSYLYFGAPRYVVAFGVNLGASVVVILLILVLAGYLSRLNKKLDNGQSLGKNGPTDVQIEGGFRFQI